MKRESKKKAFTLLELLIVMVIIGVLAIIAIPQYLGAVRSAEDTNMISELKIVRELIMGYRSMNLTLPANIGQGTVLELEVFAGAAAGKSHTIVGNIACDAATCNGVSESNNTVTINLATGGIVVTQP